MSINDTQLGTKAYEQVRTWSFRARDNAWPGSPGIGDQGSGTRV